MTHTQPVITALTAADDTPPGIDRIRDHAALHLATDEAGLKRHLPDSHILLVTDFRTDALARTWALAEQVEWIHATSAGVDQLMFDDLRHSSVTVTNARGFFDRAIAEYVLGTIIAFAKDTRGNIALQEQNLWHHRDTETILDKQVLVVGAGSIGREIGSLCRAVGMQVSGVARSARPGDAVFDAIHPTSELTAHLPHADYVVIAAPLTESTRGLFNDTTLAAMNPGARLINIGRGPIVETQALIRALDNQHLAGAALDVFEQEPLPSNHPLWNRRDVMMSAHMAGDFIGWREALIDQFLDNLHNWLHGEPLFNVVQ